jgi:hypothetical protein
MSGTLKRKSWCLQYSQAPHAASGDLFTQIHAAVEGERFGKPCKWQMGMCYAGIMLGLNTEA